MEEEGRTIFEEYEGLWCRKYIARSNGSRDETTKVWWFQSSSFHIDLRIPAGDHPVDKRTGFAGRTVLSDGNRCEWRPEIAFPVIEESLDAGFMRFEGPNVLFETGVDGTYEEEWFRVPLDNILTKREVESDSGVVTYTIEGSQWKAVAKGTPQNTYFGNENDQTKWTNITVYEKNHENNSWVVVGSTHS